MRLIVLTKGQTTIVDDEDFDKLNQHKWYAQYCASTGCYVAARTIRIAKNKRYLQYMHRAILGAPKGYFADHRNRNPLDNRKRNLRICTIQQNAMNRRPQNRSKTSKYKGVSLFKENDKWRASIKTDKRDKHIGLYNTEIEAAKAYDKEAKKYFGEFAYLNFQNDLDMRPLRED